jgi:excisionase family DNA binding protein
LGHLTGCSQCFNLVKINHLQDNYFMTNPQQFQLMLELFAGFIKGCVQQSVSEAMRFEPALIQSTPISSRVEDIIVTKDVCELFKISRPTVNEWMKSGKLPYRRIGRRVYFVRQEVLAALQSFNRRAK